MKKKLGIFFLVGFIFSGCALNEIKNEKNKKEFDQNPYVILISIDGYRYDYTDLYSPPNLKKFRDSGASAESLVPVFPSKTFTNHYSIVTGLYAENHGIVANHFYDPDRKEEFHNSSKKTARDGSWYGGEPLWVAAEKQGMLSAVYFWPGSEAMISKTRPHFYYPFDQTTSHEARVNQVMNWLKLPIEDRPHFIGVYFSDVDTAGHKFGPKSPQVKEAVLKVDQTIGALLKGTESLGLPLNVVIVSDHGMQETGTKWVEYIDDYNSLNSTRILGEGPLMYLYNDSKAEVDQVYSDLKSKGKHFQVFKRSEIPSQFHDSKTKRAGDLMLSAVPPYSLAVRRLKTQINSGEHGFDPDQTKTMHGIFYARGNLISPKKIPSFRNINIYPFIINLLGLKMISKIDGESAVLAPIIKE